MNLQPLDDRIVVRPNESEETTASGLVIPDTAKEKPQQGEVLAVGPGRRSEQTGEIIPLSPTFSVGERPQYRLFFDNLNSRFAGRENLTHLVMYRKMPGFIEGLDTEAALLLRFEMQSLAANNNNVNQAVLPISYSP
jgi:co-chaperonin GroES (HSP10)